MRRYRPIRCRCGRAFLGRSFSAHAATCKAGRDDSGTVDAGRLLADRVAAHLMVLDDAVAGGLFGTDLVAATTALHAALEDFRRENAERVGPAG